MRIRGMAAAAGAGVLVGAALLLAGSPAWAHNQLVAADPEPDSVSASAPQRVELAFSEMLDPTYTTIAVTDADEAPVAATDPAVDGTRLAVTFTAPLEPGTYTVAYRVSSNDGHPVQGSYEFTVQADGTAPPAEDASSSPAAPAGSGVTEPAGADEPVAGAGFDRGDGTGPLLLALGGAVLLVLLGTLVWWRRAVGRR